MMRTIKSRIKWWKVMACVITIPLLFFVIACQDQIAGGEDDLSSLPEEARGQYESFKQRYPGINYIVEYDENAESDLQELDEKHGKAAHIELITVTIDGKPTTFSMLQYLDKNAQTVVSSSDAVFEVVEEMAEFEGGMEGLVQFLSSNIRYPTKAREMGIQGTSFISFVIEKDGSISEVKLVKGFDAACDAESERVIKTMPKWRPGKQSGEYVRSRLTLPIKFQL